MPGNRELAVNDISVAFADPGEKLQLPAARCNSGQICQPGVKHIRLVNFLKIYKSTNKILYQSTPILHSNRVCMI